MDITITDPAVRILVAHPPRNPSHLPDLRCAGTQTIIFLAIFLVYPTHLLPGETKPTSYILFIYNVTSIHF